LSELENPNKDIVSVDSTWKDVYKVGGVCMILAGLIYIIATALNFVLGAQAGDNAAFLNSLAGNPTVAYVIFGLLFISDILMLPVLLALYLALKHINKNAMLIAAMLLFMFAILDLTFQFNGLILTTLAQHSASATSDILKAAYTAAAYYGLAALPLSWISLWIVFGLGLLIASVVMLKGVFGKVTAYLGVITGIGSLIAGFSMIIPILGIVVVLMLVIGGIWYIIVGFKLYNLSHTNKQPVKTVKESTA